MPHPWDDFTDRNYLDIVNVIVYAASNLNIYLDPSKTRYITHLSPISWMYQIWNVIDVLLLGTMIYQFFLSGKQAIINGISWRLPVLGVLNIIYLNLRVARAYGVAFIFAVLIYATVTHIYYLIKKKYLLQSAADQLFVHIPFSVCHAWFTFLVVLAAFEAFDSNLQFGAGTKFSIFLALLFLEATAAAYAFYTPDGDIVATIVISALLFAIFEQQHSTFVRWLTFVFWLLSFVWVFKSAYDLFILSRERTRAHGNDLERAPLVNGT
ncbi:hypothetical protein BDP27DRAFT_1391165 [Rhodocollybia butyracea]|uniref:Uncharacterized protein n=1 Tax=Rhodocollybia butyracea TaxID=206335 RepID=A0A9P5Q0N6_9AGAR|nr:hypothetical protein BDP27DRAFT_1391165 [Rhodocollybia butyracea]